MKPGGLLGGALACAIAACSSGPSNSGGAGGSGAKANNGWSDPLLEIPCTDSIGDVYGAPPALGDTKGAVLRCAEDKP